MLTIESRATVHGLSGNEVTNFLLDCTDVEYQAWLPGVHLQLHPLAAGGVAIRHTITAGWAGAGRLFDLMFRLYFSSHFSAAMDQHMRIEFPLLRDRLHATPPSRSDS